VGIPSNLRGERSRFWGKRVVFSRLVKITVDKFLSVEKKRLVEKTQRIRVTGHPRVLALDHLRQHKRIRTVALREREGPGCGKEVGSCKSDK